MNREQKQLWKRILVAATAVLGLWLVAVGVLFGLVFGTGPSASPLVWLFGLLLALFALLGALWKVRERLDADAEWPLAWAAGTFATPAPERTPKEYPLSSDWLAGQIEEAGRVARSEGTVADGIAVLRPALREVLGETMVAGGAEPDAVGRALETGEWTDDRLAASVLDGAVLPPSVPIRERFVAWLFPERVVRERTRRAVHAIAEVADDSLPTVPGQNAPRTVPVRKPRLEELRRDATGSIQRAVDPDAISNGSDPPDPADELDEDAPEHRMDTGDAVSAAETGHEEVAETGHEEVAETGHEEVAETGRKNVAVETEDDEGPASEREDASDQEDASEGEEAPERGEVPERDEAPETVSGAQSADGRQLRYRGAVAAAIFLVSAGIVGQNGILLLAAAIPVVYLVVGSLSTVDVPEGLTADRRIDPQPARPGEVVTVTLTVTNGTERTLTDVRLADRVPEKLAVLEGSPRAAATLELGEKVQVRYQVVARRGEYPFEPPEIRLRGLGAGAVETHQPPTAGADRLVARLDAGSPPIEEYGRRLIGTFSTADPGQGVVFHSVREHRIDDPADRIDWRHYAKRGELATVSYERDVSSTIIFVLDARFSNHVVAGPGRPTAVELAAYAATRALTDLLRGGHDVAVAVLGLDGPGPAGLHWLPPAGGPAQRARALDAFRTAIDGEEKSGDTDTEPRDETSTHDRQSVRDDQRPIRDDRRSIRDDQRPTRDDPRSIRDDQRPIRDDRRPVRADRQIDQLLELAPPGAQVALFSPLLDDFPVTAVRQFRAGRLPVTVLSPDTVPANTVSGQYAAIQRWVRLVACQRSGARAYDWRRGTPLPLVIEQAFAMDVRLPTERLTGGGP